MEFKNFLKRLREELNGQNFLKSLDEVEKIDGNHFKKAITKSDLNSTLDEYKEKEFKASKLKNIQFVTLGNPETVLRLCIESVRQNVNSIIAIEDFCLGQNTLIVDECMLLIKDLGIKIKIELKNMLSNSDLIKNGNMADKTICVGNSNEYNYLIDDIKDIEFYPYNVFMLYADDKEFDDLKRKTYDYAALNGYQMEILDEDDISFDDAIDIMNEDSYNFASVLFSKNKGRIKLFKDSVKSKYVIVNENPFYRTNFELEI